MAAAPAKFTESEEDLMATVADLWAECDCLADMLMNAVDLAQAADEEAGLRGGRVRWDRLREAIGPKLRESIRRRDAALARVGIDADDDGEAS